MCSSTEKKLLFDLAKLGWQNDSDSDSDGEQDIPTATASTRDYGPSDGYDQLEILRDAHNLVRAARANPLRGHFPRVRFVLTRVASGRVKEIDAIMDRIRAAGALVQCANDMPEMVHLETALSNMLPGPIPAVSQVLNVDYTVLRGLVSDISHSVCFLQDDQVRQVRESIEIEMLEKLLPHVLYPTIGSFPLTCTEETVEQLYE